MTINTSTAKQQIVYCFSASPYDDDWHRIAVAYIATAANGELILSGVLILIICYMWYKGSINAWCAGLFIWTLLGRVYLALTVVLAGKWPEADYW